MWWAGHVIHVGRSQRRFHRGDGTGSYTTKELTFFPGLLAILKVREPRRPAGSWVVLPREVTVWRTLVSCFVPGRGVGWGRDAGTTMVVSELRSEGSAACGVQGCMEICVLRSEIRYCS